MPDTLTFTGSLTVIGPCWNCMSYYAIPTRLWKEAMNDGRSWFCACCGKSCIYSGETTTEKLRREVRLAKEDAEWYRKDAEREAREAQAARLRERAQKAAKTRLKNRIANGVCPSCKRHFSNVERHIKNQHPDFSMS